MRLTVKIQQSVQLFATLQLFLPLLPGCQAPPPIMDGSDLAWATGTPDSVEFLGDGEAIDVESEAMASLSLAQAVSRAVRHDPQLQAALARVQSALADADQSRLLPNPILTVAYRFPEAGVGKPVIEASLGAELVAFLQQPRRVRASDNRLRAASAEALSTALDVLADVQTTYASLQALDADILILGERRKLIERLFELARSRVEFGESPQLDVLTLDSERVALDVEIAEKSSDRQQLRLELARQIGQPSAAGDWKIDPFANVALVPTDEESWISAAMQQRPDVQAQRWELVALGDDLAISKWSILDGAEIGVSAERDPDWSVGPAIAVPLPLFDWGQARQARARADIIEARHKLVQTQRKVVQEVRQAIEALISSQAVLDAAQSRLIPLQQQRIEQAEAAYRNGLADVTAVLIAEQQSQEARQKVIELQQRVASAQFRLHRAVGGPRVANSLPSTRPTAPSSTASHGSS